MRPLSALEMQASLAEANEGVRTGVYTLLLHKKGL
jgi:hypothetical protein